MAASQRRAYSQSCTARVHGWVICAHFVNSAFNAALRAKLTTECHTIISAGCAAVNMNVVQEGCRHHHLGTPHGNQQPNAEQPPGAAWHALRALRPHEQTAHHPARTCLQAAFAKPCPQRLMVDECLLVKGERTLNAALPAYMVGSDVRNFLILHSILR